MAILLPKAATTNPHTVVLLPPDCEFAYAKTNSTSRIQIAPGCLEPLNRKTTYIPQFYIFFTYIHFFFQFKKFHQIIVCARPVRCRCRADSVHDSTDKPLLIRSQFYWIKHIILYKWTITLYSVHSRVFYFFFSVFHHCCCCTISIRLFSGDHMRWLMKNYKINVSKVHSVRLVRHLAHKNLKIKYKEKTKDKRITWLRWIHIHCAMVSRDIF